MAQPAVATDVSVTTEIDEAILALVDQVASAQGRSRSQFIAEAIRRVAESEADFLAFVQEGIDALERGEVIPHEDVTAELDEMIERHRNR